MEWPDRQRETLVFVLEEESDAQRFSIHRLAHYYLDLAELMESDRVVPASSCAERPVRSNGCA